MPVDFSEQTTTGLTLRAIYWNPANGQVFNGTGFEAWNNANYSSYAVAATEQGSSGTYQATTPAAVLALPAYRGCFLKYTGTLATDVANKVSTFYGPMLPAVDSSGRVTVAPTQNFNNTGQTTALPSNVTLLPVGGTVNSSVPGTSNITLGQYSAGPGITVVWTLKDGSGNPINLAGHTLKFRVTNQYGQQLSYLSVNTPTLVIGGASNNQVTWTPTDAQVAAIVTGTYTLFDVTQDCELQNGSLAIVSRVNPNP